MVGRAAEQAEHNSRPSHKEQIKSFTLLGMKGEAKKLILDRITASPERRIKDGGLELAGSGSPGHSRMRSLMSVWYHMKVALK